MSLSEVLLIAVGGTEQAPYYDPACISNGSYVLYSTLVSSIVLYMFFIDYNGF